MSSPCIENRCGPCPVGYLFEKKGQESGTRVAEAVEAGVESIDPRARNHMPLVHQVVRQKLGYEEHESFDHDVEIEVAALGIVTALQGSCDRRPQFLRY